MDNTNIRQILSEHDTMRRYIDYNLCLTDVLDFDKEYLEHFVIQFRKYAVEMLKLIPRRDIDVPKQLTS